MKKYIKVLLLVFISILLVTGCTSKEESENTTNNNENETTKNTSLVLYFSVTNNTKTIANYVKEVTDSDILEIIPKEEYTSDDINYNDNNSRATKEQNDSTARPEISNTLNLDNYDTIYLGYPIWWGTNPKIILTLLDNYDLTGKKIVLFCTSASSDITRSVNELKAYNSNLNIVAYKRFSSSSTKDDVKAWIDGLN